jgi:hypothetical protein
VHFGVHALALSSRDSRFTDGISCLIMQLLQTAVSSAQAQEQQIYGSMYVQDFMPLLH